jgi:hypothetical protein
VRLFAQAGAAAAQRGALRTHWQRRCLANGLAAADPVAAARHASWL